MSFTRTLTHTESGASCQVRNARRFLKAHLKWLLNPELFTPFHSITSINSNRFMISVPAFCRIRPEVMMVERLCFYLVMQSLMVQKRLEEVFPWSSLNSVNQIKACPSMDSFGLTSGRRTTLRSMIIPKVLVSRTSWT